LFFLLFLVIPNLYVAYRGAVLLSLTPQYVLLLATVAIFLFLVQALGIAGERTFFPHWKSTLEPWVPLINWSAYLLYCFASILFAYLLVGDVVRIFWHLVALPENPVSADRRLFLTLGAGALVSTAIGVWQATTAPTVKRVTIALKNLPQAFDGFTIAQISDLHVGPTIRRAYVQKVVEITNGLKPDLIALTGDFVDGTIDDLQEDVAPLRTLVSTHGSYYITGNHEYYWGAQPWCEHFKTLGMNVLANEHRIITRGGESLILAGVNDYSTRGAGGAIACNPAKAIEGAPENLVKILLAHQPITFELSEPAGYDLQLSGHTHAGQYFPFNLLIPFFQKYYKGLNRHKNMWIYINSATGYWGPPLRTGVPTEITLITLQRG
jgi:uncharacterized protein